MIGCLEGIKECSEKCVNTNLNVSFLISLNQAQKGIKLRVRRLIRETLLCIECLEVITEMFSGVYKAFRSD